jgi:hypothetical protein
MRHVRFERLHMRIIGYNLIPVGTAGMAECGASAQRWRERPALALLVATASCWGGAAHRPFNFLRVVASRSGTVTVTS